MADKKTSNPTSPQRQFYTNSSGVNIDVEKLFSSIVGQIDSHRSFYGTTSDTRAAIKQKDIDHVMTRGTGSEKKYQESRCHAFYRMMGFPVINASGTQCYSPGHDPSLNLDGDRIDKNLVIAASGLGDESNFKSSLIDREMYALNSNNIFSTDGSNESSDFASASVLALVDSRPFDKQLAPSLEPTDFDAQLFEIPSRTQEFVEMFPVIKLQSIQKVKHILKPFVVDPSIELTVSPAQNRICAPFLENKMKTQITQNNYLKRPYIERVISVRFKKTNVSNTQSNAYLAKLVGYIKADERITDPNLIQLSGVQALHESELLVISKFFQQINGLLIALFDNIQLVKRTRAEICYRPIPNKNGIEAGITTNAPDFFDQSNRQIEIDIFKQTYNKEQAQSQPDTGYDSPDNDSFAFSNVDDIIIGGQRDDQEFVEKQIKTLNQRRNEKGDKANNAILQIEMLTGEFSGLGLLDIFAIQTTFWLMSPEALMGLIDQAAYARLRANKKLVASLDIPIVQLSPVKALKEFEKKLSEVYATIQSFYEFIIVGDLKNKQ